MAADYQLVHVNRVGHEHTQPYRSETELAEGDLVHVEGRDWLVDSVEGERVRLEPARYRLVLRHPDGRTEAGAFRRYRSDAPRIGHTFSTIVDGVPASWQVADDRLQRDEQGKPYRELTAERDYSEAEDTPGLPEHELEHALAREDDRDQAVAALSRAEAAGQLVELVALEPGEAPDWDEAGRYIDALILEEIEDDLFALCGVDTARRSAGDLARDRQDAAAGRPAQLPRGHRKPPRPDRGVGLPRRPRLRLERQLRRPGEPDSGHGWLSRLVDSGAAPPRASPASAERSSWSTRAPTAAGRGPS